MPVDFIYGDITKIRFTPQNQWQLMSWKRKLKDNVLQFQIKWFGSFLNPLVHVISCVFKMVVVRLNIYKHAGMSRVD